MSVMRVALRSRALVSAAGQFRLWTFSCCTLVAAGCASYHPQPIDAHAAATAFVQRRLDDPELINTIAPDLPVPDAESARHGAWPLDALLLAALRLNPTIKEARARISEAAQGIATARMLPDVTLGLGSEYDLARAQESPWLWSITTDFLLDSVLKRKLRTDLADAALQGARLDYAETVWQVRSRLRAAAVDWSLAERRVAVLAQITAERARLVQLIDRRVAAGEASPTDRLTAQLDENRSRAEELAAQRDLAQAQATLATTIGVPVDAMASVHLALRDLDTAVLPSESTLAQLREQALLSRPDLERAVSEYQAREVELHQQIRLQYPQLSIGPGYTWDHGIRKATLGISMTLPIFSRHRGPIAEARARREAAGEHVLAVQARAINEIDAAQRDYTGARAAHAAMQSVQLAAEKLLASVRRDVQVGGADPVALATAQISVHSAALDAVQAEQALQHSLGRWEDALRTPLVGSELSLHSSATARSPRR